MQPGGIRAPQVLGPVLSSETQAPAHRRALDRSGSAGAWNLCPGPVAPATFGRLLPGSAPQFPPVVNGGTASQELLSGPVASRGRCVRVRVEWGQAGNAVWLGQEGVQGTQVGGHGMGICPQIFSCGPREIALSPSLPPLP